MRVQMKIALCDNNGLFLENILEKLERRSLRNEESDAELYHYLDGNQLLEDFKSGKIFDMVILDIDMPLINGKEVARRLRIYDSNFALVFVTSYKQEVYSIFQYQVDAFIAKDAMEEFFVSELSRIIKSKKASGKNSIEENECFEIQDGSRRRNMIKLNLQDIFYFSCRNRAITLHKGTETYTLAEKLFAKILEGYSQKGFFEPCRGYLVNIKHMKCVKDDELILDNDESIPLSRRRRGIAMKYMREVIETEVL